MRRLDAGCIAALSAAWARPSCPRACAAARATLAAAATDAADSDSDLAAGEHVTESDAVSAEETWVRSAHDLPASTRGSSHAGCFLTPVKSGIENS